MKLQSNHVPEIIIEVNDDSCYDPDKDGIITV